MKNIIEKNYVEELKADLAKRVLEYVQESLFMEGEL